MVKEFEKLVQEFAHHVQAQTEATWSGDVMDANKHAKKSISAFMRLRSSGDAGRDALAVLFTHERMDVRVMSAVFLLRHRTVEAKAVLKEAAKGKGLIPFGASEALKRWEEGTWSLDPVEETPEPPETSSLVPPPQRSRSRAKAAAVKQRRSKRGKPGV